MWSKRLTFLFFFSISFLSISQFGFEFSDSVLVKKGTDTLNLAWSGGLSYVQFSDLDFDFDGDLDLLAFDRSSDNIRIFLQEEKNGQKYYSLKYNARNSFPNDIRYRVATVDYDNDGRKDLFTYGIGGVKVYRNVGDATNGLQWQVAKNLLYTDNWGTQLNLYVSSADIPSFVDVENDGDIDVLTYHISGEHLQYHQNQSMELYGIPDSLIFVLKNECWGGFREDLNTSTVYLNDNTLQCTTGNISGAELPENPNIPEEKKVGNTAQKHAGSTILALDIDNSGVLDLVLGDISFPNLNLLINGGTAPNTNSLMISQDNSFPSNSQPANMQIFPGAFWVDVDFDTKKDLLISPNARTSPENEKSILFYKNAGTNALPVFIFQNNDFLQNEMIEHGTGSQPVFFDFDQDGLKDLFVANFYRYIPTLNKESSVAYYKNTGSTTNPVYTFIDYNFLDLSTSSLGLKMAPTFGDLDGDGKDEMILGRDNGTLTYFKNTSTAPAVSFASPIQNYTDDAGNVISSGQASNPQLFDLNKDGILDLIVGKKTGELLYYENVGTTSNPSFHLANDTLGNIDLAITSSDGYAAPHFFRYLDTTYLFLGCADGKLHYFKDIDNHLEEGQSFTIVSNDYLGIDAGAYSSFYVEDIDNDGRLDLFVGQDLGGLYHFEANPNSQASLQEFQLPSEFSIYPNPSEGLYTIEYMNENPSGFVSIYDLTGKNVATYSIDSKKTQIDLSNCMSGIYLLITSNGITRKLVKQ
jgi:hypothetical protein